MEIIIPHKIHFSIKNNPSVDDVVKSLSGLQGLLFESSNALEQIFKDVTITKTEVSVSKIRSGSLYEDLIVKLIFGKQENLDDAIAHTREKLGFKETMESKRVLAILVTGIVLYGAWYFMKPDKPERPNIEIKVDNIINIGSDAVQMSPEQLKEIFSKALEKKETQESLSKFVSPAKKDKSSTIQIDKDDDLVISSSDIQHIPSYIAESDAQEEVEDYSDMLIQIRATDLDSAKRGWGVIVPDLSDKRAKMKIDPSINLNEIYHKDEITADITVIFKRLKNNKKKPDTIILRELK